MAYNGFSNPSPMQVQMKSRELLVEERMVKKLTEYVDMQPFHFFVGTWNVNGQVPHSKEPLDPWLCNFDVLPDFYVIGFQELDLDKRAYVLESSMKEMEWQKAVEVALKKKGGYKLVRVIRLVGMMLLVYVLEKHFSFVKNVSAAVVGTGIMGWMGNKGGVGVRLDFHGSELCFVTAHFAAHTEEVARRNEDFRNIWDKMTFLQLEYPKKVQDHDIIIWLGDFNYRLAGLARKEVEDFLIANKITELSNHDQLKLQMSHRKVFHGFKEGNISFRPSYKYDTGSDRWDSSEKSRVPSWCDRILWKHKDAEDVKLLLYDCRMQMQISDHKPVVALFQIAIKVVDKARKKKIYERVLKNIDREENNMIPQAAVDTQEFNFGDITFIQRVTRTLIVTNTGPVPAVFEFVGKPGSTSYCKDWLKISPEKSFISPGDTCLVELLIEVDKKSVTKLAAKWETLNDILVLHLDGGKDFFITIQGNYIPSCFGMALTELAAITQPVRSQTLAKEELLISFDDDQPDPSTSSSNFSVPPDIPVEVWMMMTHLHACTINIPDLFLQPGLPDEVEKIRDHLDYRLPLPLPGSGHSVAEAFLLYFDALPEPLVPFRFYNECLEASPNWNQCKAVLERFPKAHRATFKAFIVLLRELQKHWSRHPNSDEGTLEVIADLVLRPPPETGKPLVVLGAISKAALKQATSKKKVYFLQQFLVNKSEDEPVLSSLSNIPCDVLP